MWVAIQNALLSLNVKSEIAFSEKVVDMAPLGDREEKRHRPYGKVSRRLRQRVLFHYVILSGYRNRRQLQHNRVNDDPQPSFQDRATLRFHADHADQESSF